MALKMPDWGEQTAQTYAMSTTVISGLPRCAGQFLPPLDVYAHHEEPETKSYFCDGCRHKVWKDTGFERGRKKERETVDEVA